jgi:hypothetical protein
MHMISHTPQGTFTRATPLFITSFSSLFLLEVC